MEQQRGCMPHTRQGLLSPGLLLIPMRLPTTFERLARGLVFSFSETTTGSEISLSHFQYSQHCEFCRELDQFLPSKVLYSTQKGYPANYPAPSWRGTRRSPQPQWGGRSGSKALGLLLRACRHRYDWHQLGKMLQRLQAQTQFMCEL